MIIHVFTVWEVVGLKNRSVKPELDRNKTSKAFKGLKILMYFGFEMVQTKSKIEAVKKIPYFTHCISIKVFSVIQERSQ